MQDLIGRTLGHYRIVEKIGEGGMGEVYRAHDERLDRDVAVKVLPEAVAQDANRLARFEREARAVAKLAHPNILDVYELGDHEGRPFMATELLEGESLRELISEEGITTGKAVEYARAIADGLAAAHDKGIIHRDLKPENVFLTTDGRIKILDFGLAKLKLPEADLTTETPTATLDTAAGGLIGTVPYMAPEQVQGEPADHRSDIFALGVVLYEMLTGHRPFGGSTTVETAAAILKEDPEPISVAAPAVSPAVGSVVSKCLEKRPEDRFSSAHDLSLTLGAIDTTASQDRSVILKRWPHMLVVVIAAAIALFFVFPPEGLFERLAEQPPEVSVPRIVILPFENLGSPEDEFFADGMTEEIISRLSAVSGLLVISRTSAMQYKGTDKAIHQIGEELNVQYALEGTVRWERAGEGYGRVRITPQLIKVADDTHLWSDRYDRTIESVFEVQSDIAGQVVAQLHVSLLKREEGALNATPTDNPEAYEAFLRGQRYTLDLPQVQVAVRMFERAVELDPEFAIAWALLARKHIWLYHVGFDRTPERRNAARQAIERAMELDPALPEGHWALGDYYYRCEIDFDRALDEYAKALAIRPNHIGTLSATAWVLRRQGQWEQSNGLLQRVLRISPRDFVTARNMSTSYQYLRDFRRAEEYADLAISLAPDNPLNYLRKINCFILQGRLRDARVIFEKVPVSSTWLTGWWINLEIADRNFEEALARVHGTPEAVYEQNSGERAAGQRALDECICFFFLGDQRGVQEACGRARVTLEEKTHEYPDNFFFHARLGRTYAYLGRRDDAIREGERAAALVPVSEDALDGPAFLQDLAVIYALVGEPETAIDQIEFLLSIPSKLSVGSLRVHPWWDPLRDHPRFQALLEKYETN